MKTFNKFITWCANLFEKDDLLHILANVILCALVHIFIHNIFIIVGVVAILDIIKEVIDYKTYGWDDQHIDAIDDIIGILLCVLLML